MSKEVERNVTVPWAADSAAVRAELESEQAGDGWDTVGHCVQWWGESENLNTGQAQGLLVSPEGTRQQRKKRRW